jgi:AcrR family transcriptional regulator
MTKPYHHGDLAPALLRAAEEILEQEGPQALTLRAVARRTGVSHMAPAHHFGDLAGLLSELAAQGYQQFAHALVHAQDHPGTRTPARATGQAYVAFAREKPGLFLLMFRSERLDFARPALAEAARAASAALMRAAGATSATLEGGDVRHALARMVFDWSLVHGFSMLLIDGRLDGVLAVPGCERDAATMLDDALDAAFARNS